MRVSIDDNHLKNIANSIRTKKGTSNNIAPQNMSGEIDSIPVANLQASKTVNITDNGTQTITPDTGYDGLESVEVNTNVALDLSNYFYNSASGGYKYLVKKLPDNFTINSTIANSFFADYKGTTLPMFNTSAITNMSNLCNPCPNITSVPLWDTSSLIYAEGMFNNCTSLTTVPLLNLNNVTNAQDMFKNCTNLTSIPQLNFPKATNVSTMFSLCTNLADVPVLGIGNGSATLSNASNIFSNCPNFTDNSLNNILQICINMTNYSGTKTLYYLGFRSSRYDASRIQGLSNYQAFLDAGWTIGY